MFIMFFFFKQKTAYEMRISDWSSDVCSSDLSMDDGGSSSAVNPGSAWPSTDKDIARGHTGQLPLETWRNVNIHDERAELLRQQIRERSLSEQADAPDSEQAV